LTVVQIQDLTVVVVVDDTTLVDDGFGGFDEADLVRFEFNNPSGLDAFVRLQRGNSINWQNRAIPAGFTSVNAGGPMREWTDLVRTGVSVVWNG
jgi:hypothetical protein